VVPLEQAGLEASTRPVVRAELVAAAMLGYEILLGLSRMLTSATCVAGQAESGALVAQAEPQAAAVVPLEQAGLEASAQPVAAPQAGLGTRARAGSPHPRSGEAGAAAMLACQTPLLLSRMSRSAARVAEQAESGALAAGAALVAAL
jgi:hypothetical protein